jgi:hypothetical protein
MVSFLTLMLMTTPNKPDFDLHDFEDLLRRFLAGEQLSAQEKEQLGDHIEHLKQKQITKHNLLDNFGQAPDHADLMKRIEAHLATVPDMLHSWSSDLSKLQDVPLLTDIHRYTKIWSLKDPSSTPPKTPNPPKQTPPKQNNAPKLTNKKTPEEILQARHAETKNQQSARDAIINDALRNVLFKWDSMHQFEQQVILVLQKHALLPSKLSSIQQRKIGDFLFDKVDDQNYNKQPRFKVWIGDYIDWKYRNEVDFTCDAISCESAITAIKNNVAQFFAFSPLEEVIVWEARASKYFHSVKTTTPSPKVSTATTTISSPETKEQRALKELLERKIIMASLDKVTFGGAVFAKLKDGVIKLYARKRNPTKGSDTWSGKNSEIFFAWRETQSSI